MTEETQGESAENNPTKAKERNMATLENIQSGRRLSAKRRLEGYRAHCERHDQFLRLIESADSRLMSITAQMSENVASSSAGDAIGDGIARLDELATKLREVDMRILDALEETVRLVEAVTEMSPTAGRVLAMRYLDPGSPTFLQIADRMHYSEDHVIRLHQSGLDIAASVLTCENMSGNVGS